MIYDLLHMLPIIEQIVYTLCCIHYIPYTICHILSTMYYIPLYVYGTVAHVVYSTWYTVHSIQYIVYTIYNTVYSIQYMIPTIYGMQSVSFVCFEGQLHLGKGYTALTANTEAAFLAALVACTILDRAGTLNRRPASGVAQRQGNIYHTYCMLCCMSFTICHIRDRLFITSI